jgi:hypothetical protein
MKDEFDARWKSRHIVKRFMENKVDICYVESVMRYTAILFSCTVKTLCNATEFTDAGKPVFL